MTGFNSKKDAAADKLQEHDPCPGCIRGGVCRTPKCGRLALPLDHPFRNLQPAQSEKEKISQQMTAEIVAARALAQPAQEAVTWRNAAIRVGEDLCSVGPFGYYDMTADQWLDWALSVVTVHAPPQRQPLSDDSILDIADYYLYNGGKTYGVLEFARAIEAAQGIKGNT